MQRTRLDTLVNNRRLQIQNFLNNPWRNTALIIISILFGVFIGLGLISTAGQAGWWDVTTATILLTVTEGISRWVYRQKRRSLWHNILNVFKIGIVYSLYLQAFIIGS